MSEKKPKVKTPPRGGDAAAAWEHHLKPHEKEALAEQYRAEQARKLAFGKKMTHLIVAVNAGLAVGSIFTGFDPVVFGARVLMCIALFLGAPGIKMLFAGGAFLCVIILSRVWMLPDGSETYQIVFSIIESAVLIVSSIIIIVDENISDYLYKKRNG